MFNGFDVTMSARIHDKLLLAGGTGTGRTATVNCEVFDSPDLRFCENTPPFLTQVKLLASYSLPWDLQASGTLQSIPGPGLRATWRITNAIANAGPTPLGRNLSAGSANVELIEQNKLYGERLNQVDLRLARIFKMSGSKYRMQLMVDVYNALNQSPVITYNVTYGPEWLRPTDVLQGRLVKIGGQVAF